MHRRVATGEQMRGEDALHVRAAGVEVPDGRALEAGEPRVGRAHRCGEVDDGAEGGRIVTAKSGDGHGGARRAPGPVRVDVRPHLRGPTQPRGHLVPGDQRLDEVPSVDPQVLGHGQRGGQDMDCRVPTAPAVALIHLERHARRPVGQGGEHGLRLAPVAHESGRAAPRALGGQVGQPRVLGQSAAREHGADRVEGHRPRGTDGGGGQVGEACAAGQPGQAGEVVAGAHG